MRRGYTKLMSLAVVFLGGVALSSGAFADANLTFEVVVPDETLIEISLLNSDGSALSGNTSIDLTPTTISGSFFNEKNMTVNVGTNNEWGYNLVMSVSNTSLISTEDGSKTIPTLTAKDGGYTCTVDTANTCDFTSNAWGYKLNSATNLSAATNYLPLQSSITLNNNSNKVLTPEATSVAFGSKVNADLAPGTYSTTINFIATANPEPIYLMQSVSASELASLLPNSNSTATVEDERDGTKYTIGKLADGNYWMLDNLALDLTNSTTLNNTTASNTNASDASITSLKSGNRAAGDQYATAGVSDWTSGSSYTIPYINAASKDQTEPLATGQSGTGKIGVYYNYCAASAGSYCYYDAQMVEYAGDATEDICPKGWRMPTGGTSGEYQALYTAYSSNAADFVNALKTPLSGGFSNGSAYSQGSGGGFWSSTHEGNGSRGFAYLSIWQNVIYPSETGVDITRANGLTIRCIYDKKESRQTMQGVTTSTLENLIPNNGDTIVLPDERDGTNYTVGRLADGKVWMLDNLALVLTDITTIESVTAANTNASTTDLNYLKGISTGTSADRYATGYVSNWTSGSGSYTIPYINAASKDQTQPLAVGQSGTGKIGVYYNYCAATAGTYCYRDGTGNATSDICPKGWRMPTGGSSGEYQALYTAYSSNAANFVNALKTPLSGYFGSGSANYQGSYGYFWSSTYKSATYVYYLRVNASGVYPQGNDYRTSGNSVRCLFGA